jgi:hypothetical protein
MQENMSEEAPVKLSNACKDILEPVTTELTISENEKIRFVDIGGKLLKAGYEMETRKRLRQGLPPPLMRIVHQERTVENGVIVYRVEAL